MSSAADFPSTFQHDATATSSPSRLARSHSISSDRPSVAGSYNSFGGLIAPPLSVSPDPAFIAASAASQIITNDHDSQANSWLDQHGIEPSGETALVSPPALALVNRFLDNLLFNFLSVSKSTALTSLRPAVSEVLKTKLARDAINGADQELNEYLGGGEDEEMLAAQNAQASSGSWDQELVWKRTRLRCMVYSSLGDMEEEDEDLYTEQEQLGAPSATGGRLSIGVVSPAVAIFLTSILEFIGEQVLIVGGQAAYQRLRAKHEKEERDGTSSLADIAERVVVEESDMERVALDRTLGRLWRGWKKRIRAPAILDSPAAYAYSRDNMRSPYGNSRAGSISHEDPLHETAPNEDAQEPAIATVMTEFEHAASLPLPISDDDVREIEIPGLAAEIDAEEVDADETAQLPVRPKSMIFFNPPQYDSAVDAAQPIGLRVVTSSQQPRKRSLSVPSPIRKPYTSPISLAPTPIDSLAEADLPGSKTPDVEDETAEVEQIDKDNASVQDTDISNKGVATGVFAGAMAIGAAAVAGITAVVTGQPSQTATEQSTPSEKTRNTAEDTEGTSTDDDSSEAEIVTSVAVHSRRSSVRSSVHSLRLIDVTPGPARSRTSSIDGHDHASPGRPGLLSRSSSVYSSHMPDNQIPRIASPINRGPNASPHVRNNSSLSMRQSLQMTGPSITEEALEVVETPLNEVPADLAAAMQGVDVGMSSPRYASSPVNGELTPNGASFVLSSPPPSRNSRHKPAPIPLESSSLQSNANLMPVQRLSDGGVPPLTPLREMMEGAPDTSDEASSIAPSDGQSLSGHSPSASASSFVYNHKETGARPTTSNAARSSPPRTSREEATRKGSVSKVQRSIHTSGSSTSSTSYKLKAVPTSEDTGSGDKGQSFEQLIRSDQTIQYTLTPQNMRDIEDPDSPRNAQQFVATQNDGPRPPTSRSHSSSVSRALAVSPTPKTTVIEVPFAPRMQKSPVSPRFSKNVQSFKPVQSPVSFSSPRSRPNAPQPRDARVDRESMGDFADFIKSTGPANGYQAPQLRKGSIPSSTLTNGHRGTPSIASETRTASVSAPATAPRRAASTAGRNRLQARDAVIPRGDTISDLIDFVRSGPQLSNDGHRIPRTVAPFRTTADSDQMVGASGGRAVDASLPDPRFSQTSAPSLHNSITSQSALLSHPARANKPKPVNTTTVDEEDVMPVRKSRKARDMYDIDFSDEEDDFAAFTAPKTKPAREESLADFLRNVPPPPDSQPAPIYSAEALKTIKKKSSTPGFMSRFGSREPMPRKPNSSAGPESRSSLSRSSGPKSSLYSPIQINFSGSSDPPAYEASVPSNSYVSQLDTARNKVAQKPYQPREAIYGNTRTSDLASFLRDSEPPPSFMQRQPEPFVNLAKEESKGFQRMFSRKKVH